MKKSPTELDEILKLAGATEDEVSGMNRVKDVAREVYLQQVKAAGEVSRGDCEVTAIATISGQRVSLTLNRQQLLEGISLDMQRKLEGIKGLKGSDLLLLLDTPSTLVPDNSF